MRREESERWLDVNPFPGVPPDRAAGFHYYAGGSQPGSWGRDV